VIKKMDKEEILKQKKILVVEDEELMREIMFKWISKFAKEVLLAKNGEEGVKMYKEHSPDLIITDLEMPVMCGIKMVELIKANTPSVPVVVVTAFADEIYQVPQADGFLTKPILRADLKNILLKLA